MLGPTRSSLRTSGATSLVAAALLFAAAAPGGCGRPDAAPESLREGLARYQAATAPAGAPDGGVVAAPPVPTPPAPAPRHLQVTVLAAQGVVEQDAFGGDSDVYVALTYAGETQKTAVDEDAIDPQWHDTFVFRHVPGEALTVALWDADPLPFTDELLGTVTIFPDRATDGAAGGGERSLAFKDGENGVLTIRLDLVP